MSEPAIYLDKTWPSGVRLRSFANGDAPSITIEDQHMPEHDLTPTEAVQLAHDLLDAALLAGLTA